MVNQSLVTGFVEPSPAMPNSPVHQTSTVAVVSANCSDLGADRSGTGDEGHALGAVPFVVQAELLQRSPAE